MKDYHKYIYDMENRKLCGDFEGAYRDCEDVWPGQRNMLSPRNCYTRGLVYQKHQDLKRPLTILDIGCGYGHLVHNLNDLKIGTIAGYDISPSAIEKGKQFFKEPINIYEGNIKTIPFQKSHYDFIFLFGVFWYILDDINTYLKKIQEMLREGGELLMSLHICENPISGELYKSDNDISILLKNYFSITDVFHWYQADAINSNQYIKEKSDIFFRCIKN